MRIGFLGFGEAGYVISKGLLAKGLKSVVAYDCNYAHPSLGERIRRNAAGIGVPLLASNAELVAKTDAILSVVTADSAMVAAEQTAQHLQPNQLFCDCNSVSPSTKERIAEEIQRTRATFIEAAIMAPVCVNLNRTPVLMTGRKAPDLAGYLRLFDMNIQIIYGPIGSAAAVKMCRSIVIKGLEALLLEAMMTAAHFKCEEAVLDSLEASNPEFKWKDLSEYMIGRVLQHGTRRAAEMREVVAMQREAGLSSTMSGATAETQNWRKRLPNDEITTTAELVAALKRL